MAGFRTFATGEVLTAANVNNFLMKQSVMVFADAAARTSALGAEVAEGMLTYNEDTAQLEVFDGAAFVPAGAEPPAGIGSNVVSVLKTDVFSTGSATFVDVTGLTATITPSSATSRILVFAQVMFSLSADDNAQGAFLLLVGGNLDYRGASNGARTRASGYAGLHSTDFFANAGIFPQTFVALDSPATSSAVTYKVQAQKGNSPSAHVNRIGQDASAASRPSLVSSITVIEVAA